MSRSGDARRAFETMDTSHGLRRALLAGVPARAHTQGTVNGELVCVWRKVKKNRTDARTALVTHRWYGPAIGVGKEKNNAFVSYRGRGTKVAPGCLRKASVAEQNELGHHDEKKKPCSKVLSTGKSSRGKNPCSMILVIFLTPRCHAQQ